MFIYYKTEEDFYKGIYELLKKSMTFKADHESLCITLTGGF